MSVRNCAVTAEYLAAALSLPPDTTIHDIRFDPHRNMFVLRVAHDSFNEGTPPNVVATVSVSTHCCPVDGSVWKQLKSYWI